MGKKLLGFDHEQIHRQGGRAGRADLEHIVHASPLVSLQHSIGNQAMRRFLTQPVIQRDLDEALLGDDESWLQETPLGTNTDDTGTVTIQPVQNQFYNVTGRTLAEVSARLDPQEWGRCSYRYTYSSEITAGRASRINITLTLTIRMPRWQGQGWESASDAAKAEWNRMIAALQSHEDGHADIARRWAPIFKERMINQPRRNLQTIFNQTLAEVDAEQTQYDEQTQHGQTQGVSLDTSIDEPESE